ncbi:MAG: RMD1 family protein [Sulfurovaceae bacterium]|nr:RMD1 family protein [Sulfurovaceae bacterium]
MNLLALSLQKNITKTKIAELLNIKLNKGIENGYYGYNDHLHIVLVPFGVLAIIADNKKTIIEALITLDIFTQADDDITQDYVIRTDGNLLTPFLITNEEIVLKETSALNFNIIALAVAQSVGLEKYEKKLDILFTKSRDILELTNRFISISRSHIMEFAKHLVLTRHDMVGNLLLLDKPNILWDNEEAEHLYNSLAKTLELHDRHEIALSKLSQIQEDIMLVMDIINHKRSEFLEWIIIILIAAEIIMALFKMID